ncbi:MAG: beta-L-arabinofuranosidase domain-containing protein [Clostridiales bacterium]
MLTNTTQSNYANASPLSWDAVNWTNGFWADVFYSCATKTVPHLQIMFENNNISHVLENFRICAHESDGKHEGTVFGDGDFYKWMEAAMYSAYKTNNNNLKAQIDYYIDLIGRAQLPDGYISTKQIIGERQQNGIDRLGDINDFEVYNFGHLFTAACIHKRITGKDSFISIADKAANYLKNLYEEAAKTKDVQTAVCPSHYMGLIEMYRTTSNKDYLTTASLAIELRDYVKDGTDDNQDRLPLKKHDTILGHAVRANYLYAGLSDLYCEKGDTSYRQVLEKVWNNLVTEKLYITGGCGALYNSASPYGNFFIDQKVHQAYGYSYQLPNVTAYNETCASIGSIMWSYRMFQFDQKAKYFDLIERTMLNVNLAAISFDGTKYFYENMLRRTKDLPYKLIWPLERVEYILSYCCPPNLARSLAQSSEYAYMQSDDTLWCGIYGANTADIHLKSNIRFHMDQTTDYPYDGTIIFKLSDIQGDTPFHLNIRIPEWVTSGYINYDNQHLDITSEQASSYHTITLSNVTSAQILVQFDMPVRYTVAHPYVEETINQAAIERGPLVYCIESMDTEKETIEDLLIDLHAEFKPTPYTIHDKTVLALESELYHIDKRTTPNGLYRQLQIDGLSKTPVRLIPYFAWDNRGFGEMKIWLPIAYR